MISEGRRFDPDLEHIYFAFQYIILLSLGFKFFRLLASSLIVTPDSEFMAEITFLGLPSNWNNDPGSVFVLVHRATTKQPAYDLQAHGNCANGSVYKAKFLAIKNACNIASCLALLKRPSKRLWLPET